MRRHWAVMVLAGAVVVWCAAPLAVARAGTWGTAIEVPGLGSVDQGGQAELASVSCATAGNCTATGGYQDGSNHYQVFVVSETHGTWGTAIEVPGLGTLNAGGDAAIFSVSCASAGNCGTGGFYTDSSGHTQAFVASKVNGTWRNAIEVPGSGTLNAGGDAAVGSVSCASAGNCVAGGGYFTDAVHKQAFVVRETNGIWRKAVEVPGSGTLNAGGLANTDSVSCASAGNCVAGGDYTDGVGRAQAFVASQTNGTWKKAIEVPGSGTLPAGRFGNATLVSCATPGNCAAGLTYTDDLGTQQAFVVSETNGTWDTAIEIPGLGALNAGGNAAGTSVSCGAAGNCAAIGSYTDASGHTQAFVASQA